MEAIDLMVELFGFSKKLREYDKSAMHEINLLGRNFDEFPQYLNSLRERI